jgi:PAS domain S-box-containing protein
VVHQKKTKFGVVITLGVLLTNAVISYRATRTLIDHDERVAHTYQVLSELEATLSTLKDAETGERGYVITGVESYLEPYESAVSEINVHIDRLKQLTADNPGHQARIPILERKVADRLRILRQGIEMRRSSGPEGPRQLVLSGEGKRMMDDLRQFINDMERDENELLRQRSEQAKASARVAIITFPIDTLVACALLTLISYIIVRDIAARKRAEEALREQRQWLQVTLSSIGDAVIATDTEGKIRFQNPIAQSLTGWTQEEAEGQPLQNVFRIVNEETRRTVENPALHAMREGTVVGLANHTVLIARDGTERPIDDSGAPITTTDGKRFGAVLIFRDITARRRAERERSKLLASERVAREKAESASRAKDEFVAMISHEVRTPLNAILGWAHLLRTGNLNPADATRGMKAIERSAKTQAQLIEDLLDTSAVVTGKLSLDVRPVDLTPIIEAAIDSVRPAIDAKAIQLNVALEPKGGLVSGDPKRLQQVVWNLLANAVKFTPNHGRIMVQLDRINSHMEIRVRDSGAGIHPDFLPYVFDRFSQADTTTRRKYGGLGLGLAIVRHLVEAHGGTVSAGSPGIGLGATFTVKLPIRSTREEEGKASVNSAVADASSLDAITLAGLRILCVDDEADTRDLLTAMLTPYGAEVRCCASAQEALRVIPDWLPSILVSDIGMPDLDGYAFIKKLRKLGAEQGANIPAVALTAYARSDDRLRALAAGFQMHVPKPVGGAELITVIASLAGRAGWQTVA